MLVSAAVLLPVLLIQRGRSTGGAQPHQDQDLAHRLGLGWHSEKAMGRASEKAMGKAWEKA
jgi:hypothetical protein